MKRPNPTRFRRMTFESLEPRAMLSQVAVLHDLTYVSGDDLNFGTLVPKYFLGDDVLPVNRVADLVNSLSNQDILAVSTLHQSLSDTLGSSGRTAVADFVRLGKRLIVSDSKGNDTNVFGVEFINKVFGFSIQSVELTVSTADFIYKTRAAVDTEFGFAPVRLERFSGASFHRFGTSAKAFVP